MSGALKYVFKYIVIGDASVGKSCIVNQFLNKAFNEEYEITVGVEFGAKTVDLEGGERVKLQIWDTAGQESFKSITRAYYRAAAVALLVYDITARDSFEAVGNWLDECRTHGNPEMILVLIGNKSDLIVERKVEFAEGEQFANAHNMLFMETSAKLNSRVVEAFEQSANEVHRKIESNVIDPKNETFGVKAGALYISKDEHAVKTLANQRRKNCC